MRRTQITIPRKIYRGSKEKIKRETREFNNNVSKVENHINKLLNDKGEDTIIVFYNELAKDLYLSIDEVAKILSKIGGGSNGISL